MKTILTVLSILAATSVWSSAAPKFEDISGVEIEYWKWTSGREISYWDIVFSAEEIKPLRDVLKRARLVDSSEIAWFTTALEGTISTEKGRFRLIMGNEKVAGQPYRISITPIIEGVQSTTDHFHLSKADGQEFQGILDKLIATKIERKPDRIEKRK